MFNANNILEALKNYIRARGGQSAANNIAEAVNDLNSIPQGSSGISEAPVDGKQYARKDAEWSEVQSGEDIPDEVTNAIETNGMGWTSEEEVPAINIIWDGNTEGRESFDGGGIYCYKVSDKKLTISELIGSVLTVNRTAEQYIISNLDIVESPSPDVVIAAIEFDNASYMIYSGTMPEILDGTYFSKGSVESIEWYITSLNKEASTQETVHQIDSKYIPSSGGVVAVTFTIDSETGDVTASHTPAEVYELARSNMVIANVVAEDFVQVAGSFITDNREYFGFGIHAQRSDEIVSNVRPYIYAEISDMSSWNCVDW